MIAIQLLTDYKLQAGDDLRLKNLEFLIHLFNNNCVLSTENLITHFLFWICHEKYHIVLWSINLLSDLCRHIYLSYTHYLVKK